MTQIQDEIARLQVMADDLAVAAKSTEAEKMAESVVPNLEAIRAKARNEMDGDGLSSETFDEVSRQMGAGEDLAWAIDRVEGLAESKLVCRQFDNIHIMMSATEGLPVPENHKCWPPEDPNCN